MKRIFLGVCFCFMVLFVVVPAWATPYNLTLGITNLNFAGTDLEGYNGGYGTVTITDANPAVVTFTGLNDLSFGGHTFDIWFTTVGVNVDTGGTTPTPITPDTFVQGGTGNIDGFGRFNVQVGPTGSQGAPAAVPVVQFSLVGPITLGLNYDDYVAAAHIVIFEDNGQPTALITGDAANGNPPQVPEPTTMLLLGLGLVGLAGVRRKFN